MTATVARIAEGLAAGGLLRRYDADDGLPGGKECRRDEDRCGDADCFVTVPSVEWT